MLSRLLSEISDYAMENLMQDEYLLEVQPDVKPADMNVIVKALSEFNAARVGGELPHYLTITVRDNEQNLVGGLGGNLSRLVTGPYRLDDRCPAWKGLRQATDAPSRR